MRFSLADSLIASIDRSPAFHGNFTGREECGRDSGAWAVIVARGACAAKGPRWTLAGRQSFVELGALLGRIRGFEIYDYCARVNRCNALMSGNVLFYAARSASVCLIDQKRKDFKWVVASRFYYIYINKKFFCDMYNRTQMF